MTENLDNTPQPLYNTIVGVQANFRVSYPNHVISRIKCVGYIGKKVLNSNYKGILVYEILMDCVARKRI